MLESKPRVVVNDLLSFLCHVWLGSCIWFSKNWLFCFFIVFYNPVCLETFCTFFYVSNILRSLSLFLLLNVCSNSLSCRSMGLEENSEVLRNLSVWLCLHCLSCFSHKICSAILAYVIWYNFYHFMKQNVNQLGFLKRKLTKWRQLRSKPHIIFLK